jgi:hypothetical protein
MSGAGFESRMKHAFNLRARSKPLGDGEGGSFDGRETDGKSLESAKCKAAVVGGDSAADDLLSVAEAPVERIVADGDGAEKKIAVTANVFGDGLHGDVDAMREGVEKNAGGPGVVENHEDVAGMSGGNDGGEVLDFHGDGAGTLAPDEARVFFDERRDSGAEGGIVEIGRDAETGEETRGQLAVGVVDAGGNENVIAGLEEREIDKRDGGLATGREDSVQAGLEFADTGGEFEDRGSAVETVGVADAPLIPGVVHGGGGGEEGGGAAEGGRGEGAVALRDFGVGVDEPGFPAFGHAGLKRVRERSE